MFLSAAPRGRLGSLIFRNWGIVFHEVAVGFILLTTVDTRLDIFDFFYASSINLINVYIAIQLIAFLESHREHILEYEEYI